MLFPFRFNNTLYNLSEIVMKFQDDIFYSWELRAFDIIQIGMSMGLTLEALDI